MRLCLLFATVAIAAFAADDPYAAQLFQKHCASCHNSEAGAGGRVPQISALKSMTPAAIQKTLESGVMKQQAAPLSADERQRIASFLRNGGNHGKGSARKSRICVRRARRRSETAAWASWGGGLANMRFQSAKDAGLRAEDVPRLKLKWAFAFPDTSTMRSQPAIYRGRVFAGGQDGSVYALDMHTGCVYWATAVQSQVRSGITVGAAGGNPAVFFGDSAGFVYALDATSGKQLWKTRADEHPASTMTATPVYYKDRLYVGSASREESLSVSPGYLCCTFRGSESALDAATGKLCGRPTR
jgi:polyvinyl alcohol dehydrogenase (cytochrome)